MSTAAGADGAVFVLQADPRGAGALGDSGGAKGYGGNAAIRPSAGLEINIYTDGGGAAGIQYRTGGSTGTGQTTGDVNVASGNPIEFTLSYSAASSLLNVQMRDTTTNSTFERSFEADLSSALAGASQGFVGFTGGTGGVTATQNISDFTFGALNVGELNYGTT
jgi:hypothetical protein